MLANRQRRMDIAIDAFARATVAEIKRLRGLGLYQPGRDAQTADVTCRVDPKCSDIFYHIKVMNSRGCIGGFDVRPDYECHQVILAGWFGARAEVAA